MSALQSRGQIHRSIPHGYFMDPLLFNTLLNNMFYVKMNCGIANYAVDDHLYYAHHFDIALKNTIEVKTNSAIDWFINNHMDAKLDKFQSIVMGRKRIYHYQFLFRRFANRQYQVLGVTLDDHIRFKAHVTNICMAAPRQINALKQQANVLNGRRRVHTHTHNIYIYILNIFTSSNPVTWIFRGLKSVTKIASANTTVWL